MKVRSGLLNQSERFFPPLLTCVLEQEWCQLCERERPSLLSQDHRSFSVALPCSLPRRFPRKLMHLQMRIHLTDTSLIYRDWQTRTNWVIKSTTGYWPKRSIRWWAAALCGGESTRCVRGTVEITSWNYADVSFSCFFLFFRWTKELMGAMVSPWLVRRKQRNAELLDHRRLL